jgi:hypothetical protein
MKIPKKLLLAVLGTLALTGVGLYVWNYYDIGINSSYQAKQDFTTAFQARQTGNCDEFIKWVSDEYDAEWKERCTAEKQTDKAIAIVSFNIQSIQISGDKAFLLVELQRSSTGQEKIEPYSVNYELTRHRTGLSSWWLLNQTLR